MRPSCVRQASGVDVPVGAGVGNTVEVGEALGGREVAVGTGGFTGVQAVRTVISASKDVSSVFA
jgi:hypothetical protein